MTKYQFYRILMSRLTSEARQLAARAAIAVEGTIRGGSPYAPHRPFHTAIDALDEAWKSETGE